MKFLLITFLFIVSLNKESCKEKKGNTSVNNTGCYKGRLEIKGGCMNYTISIIDPITDTSLVMSKWKDDATGKSYQNVFALNSRCTFPDTINAGDVFYFVIDSTTVQSCPVCLMYYPVPPKKLSIKVLKGPCSQ